MACCGGMGPVLAQADIRAGAPRPYSSDWIALSSRKRIAPSLLVSAITKRTRPWPEVSA